MTRTLDSRPRLVLASLVPVKSREDPLDHAALPQTDYGVSSALRSMKTPQTTDATLLDGVVGNQHENTVAELEQKLVDVRRQWTRQQECCFDLQISSASVSTPRRESVRVLKLEPRLQAIQALIRSAGEELALAETPSSETQRLKTIEQLYTQAATQLAETVRALQAQ